MLLNKEVFIKDVVGNFYLSREMKGVLFEILLNQIKRYGRKLRSNEWIMRNIIIKETVQFGHLKKYDVDIIFGLGNVVTLSYRVPEDKLDDVIDEVNKVLSFKGDDK